MIDLTPLDVRKKRGDFGKTLRGYDPQEVDTFLELVAERLEQVVRDNMTLRERTDRLEEQVRSQEGREKAVQDALVTAQELRDQIREQAGKEADLEVREARQKGEEIVRQAERRMEEARSALAELERQRLKFLKSFRSLLERELDAVEIEEARRPLDDVAVELDLGAVAVDVPPDAEGEPDEALEAAAESEPLSEERPEVEKSEAGWDGADTDDAVGEDFDFREEPDDDLSDSEEPGPGDLFRSSEEPR